jgi:N utilization substance protein A
MRGVRIQAVVRELEGEKIDVLKYDPDPRAFIRNALQPAEVEQVIILDEPKRQALAVVPENQFSLAIGKQGLNVRLANRLVDWNIDVRTRSQVQELGIGTETQRAVSALFSDVVEEITHVAELPGLPQGIAEVLLERGVELIETLVGMSADDLRKIEGLSEEDVATLLRLLEESVEVVEETVMVPVPEDSGEAVTAAAPTETQPAQIDEEVEDEEEEVYECPECGHEVEPGMAQCPNCGVGLSFEEAEDEE